MRASLWLLPGIGLAGLALVFYVVVAAGWMGSDPTFFRTDGVRVFDCYLDRSGKNRHLRIEFRDQGRTALVRLDGVEARLEFQRGGLAGDVYRNGGVSLTLDPEAYMTGLTDRSVGPCQD